MIFKVHILGTSSAIPTHTRLQTAQVVNHNDRYYLIDCGEGTQLQLLHRGIKLTRLDAIFISHLHGDHILGLPGLLTSLSIYQRTAPLKLFAPKDIKPILDTFLKHSHSYLTYPLEFYPTEDFEVGDVIFEAKQLKVSLLPLKHRVFCRGFRFIEANKRPKFDFYKAKGLGIPNNYFSLLKLGNNITLEDGRTVEAQEVLIPPDPPKSYAYCSDTKYNEELVPYIQGTTLLYHESTFTQDLKSRAHATGHSTAFEAASIAKMAEVKHLLLGHFSARYKDLSVLKQEASEVFTNVYIAREGEVYDLKNY